MVRSEQKMDIDSKKKVASDPDQEYIYFIGLKTIPSTCYILSDESSIPFFSTSNGYNNVPFEWTNEWRIFIFPFIRRNIGCLISEVQMWHIAR